MADAFGADAHAERYRILSQFGEGWTYCSFPNPATGRYVPKVPQTKSLAWDGRPALAGAGAYLPDLPGACSPDEASAAGLAAGQSLQRPEGFGRCAALRVEERGYFARAELEQNQRRRSGSIHVFGLDSTGGQVFNGRPGTTHEWGGARSIQEEFGGRDVLGVLETFGEAHLH